LSDSPASTGTPTPLPAPAQFLTWCFFVLFCFLCRPSIPDASFRIAQRAREREERLAELRKDPQVRKRAMDQGLITKVSGTLPCHAMLRCTIGYVASFRLLTQCNDCAMCALASHFLRRQSQPHTGRPGRIRFSIRRGPALCP